MKYINEKRQRSKAPLGYVNTMFSSAEGSRAFYRAFFLTILFLGQTLMASTLEFIEVKGVKIPFIHEEDKRLPIVSMQLVFTGSGSIDEGKSAGLARISAKMMNEGTLKRGAVGFADALDARAIQLSTNAGNESFVIELGTLKEEFDTGLSLMAELLKEPNLTEETLGKVKTRALSDIARKEADFDTVASDELKAILFEGRRWLLLISVPKNRLAG